MSQIAATPRRARSNAAKQQRRDAILAAADLHLAQAGFEAFAMAEVGRLSGVAKATLYLYFGTREEILLALAQEKLAAWVTGLDIAIDHGITDAVVVERFFDVSMADPNFHPLMSRLDSVIEHNVSLDSLIDAKRSMQANMTRLADRLAPRLGLDQVQAFDAVSSLAALLLGVCQVEHGPEIDPDQLPGDVREFIAAFAARPRFVTNAQRILAGIRADHPTSP